MTDADGRYRVVLYATSPAKLCVVVAARDSSGGAVLARADAGTVPFRARDFSHDLPRVRDSAGVELVLP